VLGGGDGGTGGGRHPFRRLRGEGARRVDGGRHGVRTGPGAGDDAEVCASDGRTFVPMPFAPKADDRALSVTVKGGAVRFTALEVHELRGIWHE
jgi:hypothetical protein